MNSSKFSGRLSSALGKAEAVLHQHRLAGPVALVHAADLRNGGVRLVDDKKKVVREEIHQRVRPRSRRTPAEVARVVFDALAEAHLLHHLEVVFGAHPEALGFEQFAFAFQLRDRARRVPRGWTASRVAACRRA